MKNFRITFNVNVDEYFTTAEIFSAESVVQIDERSVLIDGKIRLRCEEPIESIELFEIEREA